MGSVISILASISVFLISRGGVEQGDLGLLDAAGHGRVYRFLVDDDALDEGGVVHGTAGLLDHLDVVHVHDVLAVDLLGDAADRVHGYVAHQLLGADHLLAHHGGLGDLDQGLPVLGPDVHGHGVHYLQGLDGGQSVTVGDDGGVYVGVDQVDGLLQQLAGQNDGGGGPIAALLVLGLGDLHQHLGGGVVDIDLLQDGYPIVGDRYVPHGVHEHFVHAPGSEGAANRVSDGPGRLDVVELGVLAPVALCALPEDQYRCVSHCHFTYLLNHI